MNRCGHVGILCRSKMVLYVCHSFLPDGTHQLKQHICSCEQCRVGKFNLCLKDIIIVDVEEESELDGLDEDKDDDDHEGGINERYEFVEVGC